MKALAGLALVGALTLGMSGAAVALAADGTASPDRVVATSKDGGSPFLATDKAVAWYAEHGIAVRTVDNDGERYVVVTKDLLRASAAAKDVDFDAAMAAWAAKKAAGGATT